MCTYVDIGSSGVYLAGLVSSTNKLWKQAPIQLKWNFRVFDAGVVNELLYGLGTIPFTEQDCSKPDAFQ